MVAGMSEIEVPLGTSLSLALVLSPVVNDVPVASLAGWSIASQVRRTNGALVADLTAVITDAAARQGTLSGPTGGWPLERLQCDVLLTGPGGSPVIRSPAFALVMTRPVTVVAG